MLTGVILAGGDNSRMEGHPKGLLPFGGERLILRQLRLMQPACSELIVVTKDPKPFLRLLDPDIRIITDFMTNGGALSGVHAGLSLAANRDVWIVGSHMPFVSAEAAKLLQAKKQEGYRAVLPHIQGKTHPLHGVYDSSNAELAMSLLQSGESRVTSLLDEEGWSELDETVFEAEGVDPSFVDCFHTQEHYEKLLQQLTDPVSGMSFPTCDKYHSRHPMNGLR
jgi:molybdenum cofactor guanylyltransferase